MSDPIKRPSGQSKSWNLGFDWATGQGPFCHLDAFAATEAAGIDFGSADDAEWNKGAQYAQNEQLHGLQLHAIHKGNAAND